MIRSALLIVLVSLLGGCQHAGLSPRESQYGYASYVMALYEQPATPAAAARPVAFPARIAVAQVGEVAPALVLVDRLRAEPTLFARVEPIPGVMELTTHVQSYGNPHPPQAVDLDEQRRQAVRRLQRLALDLGMDYLFLYGGTVDYDKNSTPLSILDLTIVGSFVTPGRKLTGLAKASGAMIDLRTGRIVLAASAESKKEKLSATAASEGAQIELLDSLRKEVIGELGRRMVAEARQINSAAAAETARQGG